MCKVVFIVLFLMGVCFFAVSSLYCWDCYDGKEEGKEESPCDLSATLLRTVLCGSDEPVCMTGSSVDNGTKILRIASCFPENIVPIGKCVMYEGQYTCSCNEKDCCNHPNPNAKYNKQTNKCEIPTTQPPKSSGNSFVISTGIWLASVFIIFLKKI